MLTAILSASPHLWENIVKALDESEYLVYMASPESADSIWVQKEIEYWLEHKSLETILIALTDGEINWNNDLNTFRNSDTNSLPKIFKDKFDAEPFYIDLRTSKTLEDVSLKNPIFKKEVLKLAAHLHGKAPKDLASDEVIAHKNMLRLRNGTIAVLMLLLVASIYQTINANQKTKIAVEEKKRAQANFLMFAANKEVKKDATLAMRLAGKALSLTRYEDTIILIDAYKIYTENVLYQNILKHENALNSVAFSSDGNTFVTSSGNVAKLWDRNGNQLGKDMVHDAKINTVAFSPDGNTVLTGAFDNTARLWNLRGESIGKKMQHPAVVYAVAFSPNGKTIVTGSRDSKARLWNLQGDQIGKDMQHTNFVNAVAFSPDGTKILTGSRDNYARLWDVEGNEIGAAIAHPYGDYRVSSIGITSVSFSPNGKTFITSAEDNKVRLWNLAGRQIASEMEHSSLVNTITFSPDGNTILTGATDHTTRLFDLYGRQIGDANRHTGAINSLSFSPDGSLVLLGLGDTTARVWHFSNQIGKEMLHSETITSVAFAKDDKTIITETNDNLQHIWTLNGKQIKSYVKTPQTKADNSRIVSPDGTITAAIIEYNKIQLLNVNGKQIGKTIEHPYGREINAMAFSPNGTHIITASVNTARLWDIHGNQIGKDMVHSGPPQDYLVNAVAFSPDGTTVLTGGDDGTARLWDLKGNQVLKSMHHTGVVYAVAFSSDGKKVVTGSGKIVKLWNVLPLKEYLNSNALLPFGDLLLSEDQRKNYNLD